MKLFCTSFFFAVALSAALLCPFSAPAGTSAESIEAKVKKTGLKYEKADNGILVFFMIGDRSQGVAVIEAGSYRGTDFVWIWSVAAQSKTRPVSGQQMRTLLKDSDKELGHWCLMKPSSPDDEWTLYYSIKLPVSATADEFKAAIQTCSSIADEIENDLFGTDDY